MYFERKHYVKKGGLVVVDNQGTDLQNGQYDHTLISVPASAIALDQAKERRAANIVLLGILNQHLKLVKDEVMENTIRENMPKAAEINIQAYRAGKNTLISGSKQGH